MLATEDEECFASVFALQLEVEVKFSLDGWWSGIPFRRYSREFDSSFPNPLVAVGALSGTWLEYRLSSMHRTGPRVPAA